MTQPDPDLWPHVLSKIAAGTSLDRDEAAEAMRLVMSGEATPAQVGGLLMALRTKGETVEEIEGLADTMLGFANPVDPPAPVVDTCGTGGDRSGTFNISTVAAIVVAGAGVPVAKHGNRAASSDLRLGRPARGARRPDRPGRRRRRTLPGRRPASRSSSRRCSIRRWVTPGPVRRELRVPTVFNFLGPLTNPARPFAQVVGVSDERMLPLLAQVLARRGTRARLFRALDGLDELTTTGPSLVFDVEDGELRESMLDPADLGLARSEVADLRGGDPEASAAIALAILQGETRSAT